MIHVFGTPDPPVPRLIAALAARGHASTAAPAGAPGEAATLVLGPGPELDELALEVLLASWRRAAGGRVLVLSLLGVHPDARVPRLRRLWQLEERVRDSSLPSLTLRLAPLLSPESPLWLKLRSRPRLPRGGRTLIQPVAEADCVESLARALDDRLEWRGWYELVGPAACTLAELETWARPAGPSRARGEWEPPLEELDEHRLGEPEPWMRQFQLQPRAVTVECREWAA